MLSDTRKELEKLRQETAKLEILEQKQLKEFQKNTPAMNIAEALHGLLCRSNHTDGCSWEYEYGADKWSRSCHVDYLRKAEMILKSKNLEDDIIRVIGILQEARYV